MSFIEQGSSSIHCSSGAKQCCRHICSGRRLHPRWPIQTALLPSREAGPIVLHNLPGKTLIFLSTCHQKIISHCHLQIKTLSTHSPQFACFLCPTFTLSPLGALWFLSLPFVVISAAMFPTHTPPPPPPPPPHLPRFLPPLLLAEPQCCSA